MKINYKQSSLSLVKNIYFQAITSLRTTVILITFTKEDLTAL